MLKICRLRHTYEELCCIVPAILITKSVLSRTTYIFEMVIKFWQCALSACLKIEIYAWSRLDEKFSFLLCIWDSFVLSFLTLNCELLIFSLVIVTKDFFNSKK